jgi:hypothetical protein
MPRKRRLSRKTIAELREYRARCERVLAAFDALPDMAWKVMRDQAAIEDFDLEGQTEWVLSHITHMREAVDALLAEDLIAEAKAKAKS